MVVKEREGMLVLTFTIWILVQYKTIQIIILFKETKHSKTKYSVMWTADKYLLISVKLLVES